MTDARPLLRSVNGVIDAIAREFMRVSHLFRCSILLLVVACARSTACDPATAECGSVATTTVNLGQDIVLAPGQTVAVEGTSVRIAFDHIVADSRCPRDVVCVWAGNAQARVRILTEGDTARTLDINSTVEPKLGQFDGYTLRFVSLTPEPVSTAKIDSATSRLTVRLERS